MRDIVKELSKQMTGGLVASPGAASDAPLDLQSIAKLQQAMTDMTAALKMNVIAIEQMAEAT